MRRVASSTLAWGTDRIEEQRPERVVALRDTSALTAIDSGAVTVGAPSVGCKNEAVIFRSRQGGVFVDLS